MMITHPQGEGNMSEVESKMDKKHCRGCRDDFYNHGSNLTSGECWLLKKAKLVARVGVGHWENPPYKNKEVVTVPHYWNGEGSNRTHYIDPQRINSHGYIQ